MHRAASPLDSLLAASRALSEVADAAEGEVGLRAEDLRWLCSSLLPANLELGVGNDPRRPDRVLLQEAEAELRHYLIGAYPAGTIDVVVGLCDLLRESAESST